MKIERERVRETFREYTDAYDATDEKIKLKIDHTYRVAELCERIAKAEQMEKTEVDLAWLLGMLHDVGRFEQLRRYGTFSDADSIDHAALGADILFGGPLSAGKGLIRTYVDDAAEDEVIETAIRVHSAYRIPEGLAPRTKSCAISCGTPTRSIFCRSMWMCRWRRFTIPRRRNCATQPSHRQ